MCLKFYDVGLIFLNSDYQKSSLICWGSWKTKRNFNRLRDTIYLKTMGKRIKWIPNTTKVHWHTQLVHQSRGARKPILKPVPGIRRRSTFIATIESCINETCHITIELTPYETQFERRPTRVWERYINQEISGDSISDNHQIFVKMKMKREKHANKINDCLLYTSRCV